MQVEILAYQAARSRLYYLLSGGDGRTEPDWKAAKMVTKENGTVFIFDGSGNVATAERCGDYVAKHTHDIAVEDLNSGRYMELDETDSANDIFATLQTWGFYWPAGYTAYQIEELSRYLDLADHVK